jgi:hypothetical protein
MRLKHLLIVPVAAAAFTFAGISAASAGEVNGNGDPIPATDHARSICAFSGQNDTPNDPVEGGRVQSFGQIVRFTGIAPFKGSPEHPGNACNGNHGFLAGGGGE